MICNRSDLKLPFLYNSRGKCSSQEKLRVKADVSLLYLIQNFKLATFLTIFLSKNISQL